VRSLRDVPITEGPDGLWHAKVTVGHKPDGSLDRRHRSGKTAKEVERKLRELFRQLDSGTLNKAGRAPTVEEWFGHWLTEIAPFGRKGLRPLTLKGYRSNCRVWVFPHIGKWRLDTLDTDHLDALYKAMRKAGRSDGTILQVHAIIRRGLAVAQQRGKVHRNIAKLIDSPGTPRPKRTPLATETAHAIVAQVQQRRNRARWLVGLAIGPRQGEALGLCWPEVDLDAGTVAIAWQLQRLPWQHGCADPHRCGLTAGKGGRSLHRTKPCPKPRDKTVRCARHRGARPCPSLCEKSCTGHAAFCPKRQGGGRVLLRPKTWDAQNPVPAVIGLPAQVVEALREHRRAQAAERLHAGTRWRRFPHPDGGDADLVFRQVDGAPIDPRQDWGEFQEILTAAGLPRERVHAMRHTAATMMIDLGIDIAVVQEVLRHRQIQTTRGYATVRTAATARAAEKMDQALFGGTVTDLVTEREKRRGAAG
jgi:integrase